MSTIEDRLAALRADIDWPPTPRIDAAVAARIAAEPRRGGRRRPFAGWALQPAVGTVAVIALLLVAAVLAASPDVRADIARLFGIGGVRVEHVRELPRLERGAPSLGKASSLAEAELSTGLEVTPPRALGRPDAVFLSREAEDGVVTLAYRARRGLPAATGGLGLLLSVFRGDSGIFVKKILERDRIAEPVDVNGAQGYWIGGPHAVLFVQPSGAERVGEQPPRLAANTLFWMTPDGVTHRLETALPKAAALRIARSAG